MFPISTRSRKTVPSQRTHGSHRALAFLLFGSMLLIALGLSDVSVKSRGSAQCWNRLPRTV